MMSNVYYSVVIQTPAKLDALQINVALNKLMEQPSAIWSQPEISESLVQIDAIVDGKECQNLRLLCQTLYEAIPDLEFLSGRFYAIDESTQIKIDRHCGYTVRMKRHKCCDGTEIYGLCDDDGIIDGNLRQIIKHKEILNWIGKHKWYLSIRDHGDIKSCEKYTLSGYVTEEYEDGCRFRDIQSVWFSGLKEIDEEAYVCLSGLLLEEDIKHEHHFYLYYQFDQSKCKDNQIVVVLFPSGDLGTYCYQNGVFKLIKETSHNDSDYCRFSKPTHEIGPPQEINQHEWDQNRWYYAEVDYYHANTDNP